VGGESQGGRLDVPEGMAAMNVWGCDHEGCKNRCVGVGSAIGLRAIGWYFVMGDRRGALGAVDGRPTVLLCPLHRPDGVPCMLRDRLAPPSSAPCAPCAGRSEARRHQHAIARAIFGEAFAMEHFELCELCELDAAEGDARARFAEMARALAETTAREDPDPVVRRIALERLAVRYRLKCDALRRVIALTDDGFEPMTEKDREAWQAAYDAALKEAGLW
jgi:hypothetical protein